MDLPKQSMKVNPESSENNQSGSEVIFFWNENTKIIIKLIKRLIETAKKKKKTSGHSSLMLEFFLFKVIFNFCLLLSFPFWNRDRSCGLEKSNKVNMKQT